MHRVTRRLPVILAVVVFASIGSAEDDFQKLEGTWQLVEMQINGNTNTKDAKKYKWVFADGKYTILQNDKKAEVWKVQLNGQSIDSKHFIGEGIKGRELTGIYELAGNTLQVCYDLIAKGRPDKFKTTAGSRRVLYVLQRQSSSDER